MCCPTLTWHTVRVDICNKVTAEELLAHIASWALEIHCSVPSSVSKGTKAYSKVFCEPKINNKGKLWKSKAWDKKYFKREIKMLLIGELTTSNWQRFFAKNQQFYMFCAGLCDNWSWTRSRDSCTDNENSPFSSSWNCWDCMQICMCRILRAILEFWKSNYCPMFLILILIQYISIVFSNNINNTMYLAVFKSALKKIYSRLYCKIKILLYIA